MEAVLDPGQQILDELVEIEVERAKLEAKAATKMLEFADLRRQSETEPNPTVRDLRASFAADELGLALHLRPGRCSAASPRPAGSWAGCR
jgi:hypothetical protein